MNVNFLFRRKNPKAHSIERVFESIIKNLPSWVSIKVQSVPEYTSGLRSIFRNLLFIRLEKDQIYHVTGDVHYLLIALPGSRTVLTIHDLVFLNNSRGLKRMVLKWLFIDIPVRKARIITTISESSRREILAHSKCNPEKIVVIPNPVDERIRFDSRIFNAENPQILFIGTKPNKNLERTIEALRGMKCSLHIVGQLTDNLNRLLIDSGLHFKNSYGLSDEQMALSYSNADIILFPSLYEGFGLPVIEGMKAGRVVITSNISPMKELADGGACLVDPQSIDSIRNGFCKVVEDEEYRNQLIARGLIIAESYSPKTIAAMYADVYKTLKPGSVKSLL